MSTSNQQNVNRQTLEHALKEKPLSLSCIVARNLIRRWVSVHESESVSPKDLLLGTPLEFAHNFFHDELQSAIAQSKYIHPNIITTLHAKIRGTIKENTNNGSKNISTTTDYLGDRKLQTKAQVMWSQEDRIVEIYISTQGGLQPPSVISNYVATLKQSNSISGEMISVKFQSQTGMTKSGLEDDDIVIHDETINDSLQPQSKNEWIQFRPLWKINGISMAEVDKYLYTCTQIVYNRLVDAYNQDGLCETSVPHLAGKVAANSTMIEMYSCPCNIYKCRGLRNVPGWSNRICPFMGHELHPRGFISSI